MADITIIKDPAKLDAELKSIGDSIRAKGGTTAPFNSAAEMVAAVDAIQTGGGKPEQYWIDKRATGWPTGDFKITASKVSFSAFSGIKANNITCTDNIDIAQYGFFKTTINTFIAKKNCELAGDNEFGASKIVSFISEGEAIRQAYRSYAFQYCRNLTKFDILSNGRYSICPYDFQDCTSLKTIILRNSFVSLRNKNAFLGSAIEKGEGYVYVPKALVDQYKVATNWVTYADQIRAIEDYPDITGG